MSPAMATFVMMSNYFHDVATATVLALGVVLWLVVGVMQKGPSKISIAMVRYLRKVLLVCLVYLFAGGVVRILAFSRYELPEASSKGLVSALFIKHIVAFLLILAGVVVWQKGIKRFREVTRDR